MTDRLDPAMSSPSLAHHPNRDGFRRAAFELKYLLDHEMVRKIEAWAADHLSPDPHADPAFHGAYRTTTLYFDTPELDVYHRSPGYAARKFRIRRYGSAPAVYLECKTKRNDRVTKRRSNIPLADLPALADPGDSRPPDGQWFHEQIIQRRLQPAALIAYERTAHIGSCPEGPLRLTIDRQIRARACDKWSLDPAAGAVPVFAPRAILELKFLDALPIPFKQLAADFRLSPLPISKYRSSRDAWSDLIVERNGTPKRA